MNTFSSITLILIFLLGAGAAAAQKKIKTPVKRGARTPVKMISQPKIEVESWQEFESTDLKLRLIFPKAPTISENNYVEFGRFDVKSSIIQSFINTDFYMVEVREYPKDALADRNDLGESYGGWLKDYILSRVKITSEKTVSFGQYKLVEFVYQQSPNEVTIHRAFVVGQKLYQIIVQFEVKKPETLEQTIEKNKPKIDKFFLSFELTENEFTS
jgi:hypothetical protein